ncbi:MAG: hypothetical protein ISP86_03175 [Shewanellaceae bacterium]|nr:hypothetical protein [Shewanellaceae bacterium]
MLSSPSRWLYGFILCGLVVACTPTDDDDKTSLDGEDDAAVKSGASYSIALQEMAIKQQYSNYFDETMSDTDIKVLREAQAKKDQARIDALLLKMDDMIASGLAMQDGQLAWSQQMFHELASEHPNNPFAPAIGPMITTMCKAPIKFRRFIKKLTNLNVVGNEAPEVIYDAFRRTVSGLVGPWEAIETNQVSRALMQGEYALKDGMVARIIKQIRNSKGDYNYLVAIVNRGVDAEADEMVSQFLVSNIFDVSNLKDNILLEQKISNINLQAFYKSKKTTDTIEAFNNFFQTLEKNIRQAAASGIESADLNNTIQAIDRYKRYKNMYQLDVVRTELDRLASNIDFLKQVKKFKIDADFLKKIGDKYDSYLKLFEKNNGQLMELMSNNALLNHIQTNDYLLHNSEALKQSDKKLYKLVEKYNGLIKNRTFDNFENMRPKQLGYMQSLDEAVRYQWFNDLKPPPKTKLYKKAMRFAKKKILGSNKTQALAITQNQDIIRYFAEEVKSLEEAIETLKQNQNLWQQTLAEAKNATAVKQKKLLLRKVNALSATIKANQAEITLKKNSVYNLKKNYPSILEQEITAYAEVLPIYSPKVEQPVVLREMFEGEWTLTGIGDDQYVARIMKKMNVQSDGSADYIVSVVNRNRDAPVGMVDQYLIKSVYDDENLVKQVVHLREASIGAANDIWTTILGDEGLDTLLEKLAELESKSPQSAHNLFNAERNLFNLDVFITELQQSTLNQDPLIQDIVKGYQQQINKWIGINEQSYQAYVELQKNAKIQAYFNEIITRFQVDGIPEFETKALLLRDNPELQQLVSQFNELYNQVTYDLNESNLRSKNLTLAQTFDVDVAYDWYPKKFREHLNAFIDRLLNRKVADANLALFDSKLDPLAVFDDGVVINIPETNPAYVPMDTPTTTGGTAGTGDIDVPTGAGGAGEVDVPTTGGEIDVPNGTGGAGEIDVPSGTGGAGEIDVPTGTATVADELIETADKALSRRLVKAMQALAVDVGVELLASSYAIYTLDGAYYARTYAERNKQAALATSMLFESLAGLGVSTTIYVTEASGVMPVLIPLAIFLGVGITTNILLDKRYDKMDHAQKAQLFLHQLYHKYFVFYQNPRNLYQLSDLTGAQVLVTAKDADVLVDKIDLSGEKVALSSVGTLHLPLMDKHNTLLPEHINVMDYWRRIGTDKPSDDLNKTDGETEFYPQQTFPDSASEAADYAIPTAAVDAVVLPGQPKFIDPWERRVISTKKGGVYAKNYQLGARLALTLERTLFTNFKPNFFMQENRHLYKFNHDQRQLLPTTDVTVKLPKQSLDVLLPHGIWISPFLPYMAYRLSAPEQPKQYYGFQSDYFKPLKVKDAVEGTLVRLKLNSSSRDIFWDLSLMGLSFEEGATLTQANGQIEIAQGTKKILIDTQRMTGHLIINGLLGEAASIRYVRIDNGEIKSNRMRTADQALYMQLKQAHRDKVGQRTPQAPTSADKTVEPTTLFISNATWEQGKATISYDDGSTDVVNIAPEDTTQVNLYRPTNSIASMTFETTKSVKYKANPKRTLNKDMIMDYLIEGIPMLCYQLNQGQMARDFRSTAELCTANMPSYLSGKEPVSPALSDDNRLLYKIEHVDVNDTKTPVKYYKLSIDNQTNLDIYMSIRYEYQGQEYRLVVDEKLLPWQKIQYAKGSQGSRADFYIPAGATLLSLRAERLLKDDLFNVFTTLEEPLVGTSMTQDRYLDINKRLLKQATMVDIDAGKREQRYLDSYRASKQLFENQQYIYQNMRY